jgi:gamma-glutamylputrescine oxidase
MHSESVSHWQRTVPAFPLATDLPPTADVVVVGGGLLGCRNLLLVSVRRCPCSVARANGARLGATGRNGGFVRAGPAGSHLEAKVRLGSYNSKSTKSGRCSR